MNHQTLELRLTQLEKALLRTQTNKYSDKEKEAFHEKIIQLVSEIRKKNIYKFSKDDLAAHRFILNIIFTWVEFLDNSTINLIPYEIVNCLKTVLKDWIDDHDDYIIVTSLTNKLDDYSLQYIPQRMLKLFNSHVEKRYGITFPKKLIQLNLPKYLVHDYLANVVLYHEIGHFIDMQYYRITGRLVEREFRNESEYNKEMLKAYLGEHFADLFAAQYIGPSSNHYLSYIAFNNPASDTHPSTTDRVALVNKFLNKKKSDHITQLKKATKAITNRDLKVRYTAIPADDFDLLIPAAIRKDSELHYLFILGWAFWLNKKSVLREKFKERGQLNSVINNLIEKSISNYFLLKQWGSKNVPRKD